MSEFLTSERDVEVKIVTPLFLDVLGYSEQEMNWAVPVKMNMGEKSRRKKLILSSREMVKY
ncbi:hypothetical protein SAMN05444065_12614 [Pseudomonas syringae]|uniref:Uncharacterized protein n=1 Tax=Pseudomonas syringae TaxID=317 RepID=A0AB38C0R1_PSESX|nr:hypothetical protein SAMN05444065_12614 [Pseudomonas syringae]SFO92941.1 type I restriction enzyme M protein [Pseudomonas syringae]